MINFFWLKDVPGDICAGEVCLWEYLCSLFHKVKSNLSQKVEEFPTDQIAGQSEQVSFPLILRFHQFRWEREKSYLKGIYFISVKQNWLC